MLLNLISEWQGCESRCLESGSRAVAAELFAGREYVDLTIPVCDTPSVRDDVFAFDCVLDQARHALRSLEARSEERVFTVGGTCGAEAAPVAYLSHRYPDLGVIWLDAHGDLNTPATSPSGHFHGMVLRTLLGDGPPDLTELLAPALRPERVVVAGARDLDVPERSFIDSAGIGLVQGWPPDTGDIIIARLHSAAVRHVYVHVDVDVFDPTTFGDALFKVEGGPAPDSVAAAVRRITSEFDLVGVGLVESCGRDETGPRALKAFAQQAGVWPAY